MEWSKTKSIMIVALVITNLIIGYFYWQEFSQVSMLSDKEQLRALESIFLRNQLDIASLVPIEIDRLPKIKLTVLKVDSSQYQLDQYNTLVENQNTLLLTKKMGDAELKSFTVEDSLSKQAVADRIEGWFVDALALERDFTLVNVVETDDGFIYNYGQLFKEYFVDGSYMSVHYSNNEIMRFQRRWYAIEEVDDQTLSICSYPMALYRLLDNILEEGQSKSQLEFTSVNIGYKLESNAFDTTIESGEGSPYFRFRTLNGDTFLVEALWVQ